MNDLPMLSSRCALPRNQKEKIRRAMRIGPFSQQVHSIMCGKTATTSFLEFSVASGPVDQGRGFHEDFDLEVASAARNVHGAEDEGLVGGEKVSPFQRRGLGDDPYLRDA